MQIHFFTSFSKRENSTKQALVANATVVLTGYLREPCSIMNPTFKIEPLGTNASPQSYTYAYIGEFARYYFVDDWTWSEGVWQCSLKVDVLASFKTQIGATSAYIERCASAWNGAVTDKLYPVTTNFSTEVVSLASTWHGIAPSGGCFVLGVICGANNATAQNGGAVTYYVLTPAQMKSLMNYLLGDGFLDDNGFPTIMGPLQQLSHDTAKAMINPSQYISSCMWFPCQPSTIGDGQNHDIQIGYYDMGSNHGTGQFLNALVYQEGVQGQIPVHPQAATRGKYLNYSPYTRLTLQVPPFGSIPLDTSFCEIGSYLNCKVWVDSITGKATMRVELYPDSQHQGTGAIVTEASTQFGVPIQIAQMNSDMMSFMGQGLQTVINLTNLMSGTGSAVMNAAGVVSGVGNALDSLMPQVEKPGVNGSFLTTVMPPILTAQHFVVANDNLTEFGRPLMDTRTINTLSGFIKCKETEIQFPCFSGEKERIIAFMHSGFFWE